MTYLDFIIIFLIPPIVILLGCFQFIRGNDKKTFFKSMLLLSFLALTYTTPWDNYLVKTEVWSYGIERVIGTIGYVPIEEYCFFILQTFFTGLWSYLVYYRLKFTHASINFPGAKAIVFIALVFITVSAIFLRYSSTTYLALILVWSLPVIFLQIWVGSPVLKKNMLPLAMIVIPPTLYLWFADAIAIDLGIWEISATQTTGLKFYGLPIEEAIFFLVTNIMVGQGMLLFVVSGKEVMKACQEKLIRKTSIEAR